MWQQWRRQSSTQPRHCRHTYPSVHTAIVICTPPLLSRNHLSYSTGIGYGAMVLRYHLSYSTGIGYGATLSPTGIRYGATSHGFRFQTLHPTPPLDPCHSTIPYLSTPHLVAPYPIPVPRIA
eukprot:2507164-Rhodomonas_salina.1